MPAVPATPPSIPSIRDRYRAQVRQEVKQAALAQLAAAGPAGLSVSAIGKELGVSGPALYRYFASRDELLTELVIDAYDDLAGALRAAADSVRGSAAGQQPRAQLDAVARAYRAWALAQPHRYRLLFGPPLPGYDAHAGRLVEAARASMDVVLEIIGELGDDGLASAPPAGRRGRLAAGRAARGLGRAPACRHRTGHRAARGAGLEPAARLRQPGDRRELRLHGHRSRSRLRGPAGQRGRVGGWAACRRPASRAFAPSPSCHRAVRGRSRCPPVTGWSPPGPVRGAQPGNNCRAGSFGEAVP